jgi:flagellar biosynthetic protein FlhB
MGFAGAKIGGMIGVIFPVFLALFAGSVLSCVVVTGLNFSSQSVKLKWESLNPVKGFTNLINARSFVKLLISIAKITVVSLIVWFYINGRSEQLASLRWNYSGELLPAIAALVLGMMVRISVALLIIAAIDAIYQRYKYIQDLKMTKQEVKEENRDTEGSPELKARIRQIQSEMAKKRMLQEVPKADVVLTNPTHYAVALKYDAKEMDCPVVVAKGADNLAQKIRETASSAGVPVIRRPQLTRTLYSAVECGDPVPQTLFVAVAEVLAMIYRRKQGK